LTTINQASEGAVVVLYFEPSATHRRRINSESEVLRLARLWRAFPEGKQHGKIDPISGIHQRGYPRICHFAMILAMIAVHYLIFAILFMQLRG